MKIFTRLLFFAVAGGLSSQIWAQTEVEIEWNKPEKFRDVRPNNGSRKRFRESTFKQIHEYMNELALTLPENKKLLMTVSDLDLAGQVWPSNSLGFGHVASDVRIIRHVDIPRINFSYQLSDNSGQVLQQADVKLKDMAFLDRSRHFFRNEHLRYEKNMLKRWFNKEFDSLIVKNIANKGPVNSEM